MKRLAGFALVTLALAACQDSSVPTSPTASAATRALAPTLPALGVGNAPTDIPGQYIVLLKANVSPITNATALAASQKGRVKHVYSSGIINGFAIDIDDTSAVKLSRDTKVLAVVPDQAMTVSGSGVQTSAPWGLDRIDQAALPLNATYAYPGDGAGTTVYIVDTGINYGHTDFGGRATTGYDAITSGGTATDCHGHGTHVAGTVGGTKYGVAKAVALVGVRVLDCSGNGSSSSVLAGLDYVLKQKQANPSLRAVVNMSLGGGIDATLDAAVANLTTAGVTVVVAAGNSTANACNSSPARAPSAITVGATDSGDRFATFSNYGACVDIDAPGVSITSDYIGSTTAAATMSGTSMASPHVAGAAALYLAANPTATPAQVATALTTNATPNKITAVPASTVNKLLSVGFLGSNPPPNQPPTASITAPASGASFAQGATVTFTGTGADPETGALTGAALVWTSNLSGQIGTGTSFSTSTLSVGTHTITLTAKDPQGATGTATRTITITPPQPPNQPPTASITSPTAGASFVQGASVSFSGTGTDPESGALSGAALVWTSSINGQIGTGTSFSTSTLSVGTHTITLTAKDPHGATGTATRTITITAPQTGNTPPVANFTWSCVGFNPHQCQFDGSSSTDDKGVVSYAWTWGNGTGETKTVPVTKKTYLAAGTYNVTLTVTDAGGLTSSITQSVTVP